MSTRKKEKSRMPQGVAKEERRTLQRALRRAEQKALRDGEEPPPARKVDWVGRLG